MSTDVPLSEMLLIADLGTDGKAKRGAQDCPVKIVRFRLPHLSRSRTLTLGASEARWAERPEQRMLFLYEILWRLQLEFGFCPQQLHEAAKVIPEYRDLLGHETVSALAPEVATH